MRARTMEACVSSYPEYLRQSSVAAWRSPVCKPYAEANDGRSFERSAMLRISNTKTGFEGLAVAGMWKEETSGGGLAVTAAQDPSRSN